MGETTTVKVRVTTRDLLRRVGDERQLTADAVIRAGLDALSREERRRVAAAEARAIATDPQDLAEVLAIQQDMADLHAR